MKKDLHVGDGMSDGSIVVIDEDRLCYKIKSISNGAVGVRTISKELLMEWVTAYEGVPNESAEDVRKRLRGKSEIDRYEYGYAGTLAKMAKMVLGQIPVVRPSVEERKQQEFYDWMVSIGKAPTYAKDVARSYLPTISDEPSPPSKSMWHGLREYLYNAKPPKRIYEINSLAELNEVYSGIDRIFGTDATPGAFDPHRYNDCWTWAHDSANHNSVSAAWNLYKQFLQWCESEKKIAIKEEVMKKQWKPVNSSAAKKSGTRTLSDAFANDEMLKRLAAALRTKPFAILAGHSGTGKSQLVRRLAYMTCNNELLAKEGEGKTAPGNYCMVQVKPNWHDSTDLIGYYSEMGGRHFVNTPFVEFICKAYAYPDTPFFVCLDEMNLAPVEQYFAEYLSAIESMEKKDGEWVTDPLVEVDKTGEKDADGKEKVSPEIVDQIMQGAASTEAAAWIQSHGLTIPKNLFVVGTVNMDETTCQFSRKVLDRAMTLLMNDVKFADMANSKKPSEEELLDDDGLKFFLEGEERGKVGETESKLLDGINEPLNNTAFVVAYRFANEYALYESAWAKLNGVDMSAASEEDKTKFAAEALDHVVLMKLLPRIHGEAKTVKGIFAGRKADGKDVPGLKSKLPSDGLSVAMMDKIMARDDEYLTFWP